MASPGESFWILAPVACGRAALTHKHHDLLTHPDKADLSWPSVRVSFDAGVGKLDKLGQLGEQAHFITGAESLSGLQFMQVDPKPSAINAAFLIGILTQQGLQKFVAAIKFSRGNPQIKPESILFDHQSQRSDFIRPRVSAQILAFANRGRIDVIQIDR